MKLFLITILVFFFFHSFGQNSTTDEYGILTITKAEEAYCKGDTNLTITLLEEYIQKYGNNKTALKLSLRLAEFYIAKGEKQLALKLLTTELEKKRSLGLTKPITENDCGLYNTYGSEAMQYEVCIQLSNIYQSLNNDAASFKYLQLANIKYFPNFGCGNAYYTYKSGVSEMIANHYLKTGDSIRAIRKLLQYYLHSPTLTKKLHKLLLESHTQSEISKEFVRAIKNSELRYKDKFEKKVLMTIFGTTYYISYHNNAEDYKNTMLEHRNTLLILEK